jgi:hypothetical protein
MKALKDNTALGIALKRGRTLRGEGWRKEQGMGPSNPTAGVESTSAAGFRYED